MPLDADDINQALKKLRKSLWGFPKKPSAEDVHDLRTRARRVESTLQALELDSAKNEKRLLSGLKSVRSRAGKVRDMDVFTSHVIELGARGEEIDCTVRLVHHLGFERHRHATKLYSMLRKKESELRRRLKLSRQRVKVSVEPLTKQKANSEAKRGRAEPALHAATVALRLSKELAAVSHLGPNNLHPYRIEVKRLRYVLEMAEEDNPKQQAWIEKLKEVQDAIGEWHDWLALTGIAKQVLDHQGCQLIHRLNETVHTKLAYALRITQEMRRRYLSVSSIAPKSTKRRRMKANGQLSDSVLIASSEIVS